MWLGSYLTTSITTSKTAATKKCTKKCQHSKPDTAQLKRTRIHPNYLGGGETEWGERYIARQYTRPDSSVLEFGGGAGSVSVTVSQILHQPQNHVVIQPREPGAMFGGLDQLQKNRKACGGAFTVVGRFLKAGDHTLLQSIPSTGKFDTIIADCEGCLVEEFQKNPQLFSSVTQIQVERDDIHLGKSYDDLFTNVLGMTLVESGKTLGCDGGCDTEVWER